MSRRALLVGILAGLMAPGFAGAWNPIREAGRAAEKVVKGTGQVVEKVGRGAGAVSSEIHRGARKVGGVFGKGGRRIADVATTPTRMAGEFSSTAIGGVGRTLQGEDPAEMLTAPLAAMIRDANRKYRPYSRPIPSAVRRALRGVISDSVLTSARYATSRGIASLPAALNLMKGRDHAVCVGDIIVFGREPQDHELEWWAHELKHVEQYQRWGIDKFAWKYSRRSGQIEAEADRAGSRAVRSNRARQRSPQRQRRRRREYRPRRYQQPPTQYGRSCQTQFGGCWLGRPAPVGMSCSCQSYQGLVPGLVR